MCGNWGLGKSSPGSCSEHRREVPRRPLGAPREGEGWPLIATPGISQDVPGLSSAVRARPGACPGGHPSSCFPWSSTGHVAFRTVPRSAALLSGVGFIFGLVRARTVTSDAARKKERERHRVSLRRGSNREGENAAEKDLCGATRAAWPAGRSRAAGVPARDPMGAHLSHATCPDPRHMKAAPSAGLLQLLSEQQNVKRSGLVNRSGSTCPSALAKLAKGS